MGKHTIAFVEQPKPKEKVQTMENVVAPMPKKEKNAIDEQATKMENTASTKGKPVKATKKINHAWQYRQIWIPKSQLGKKQIWIRKDEASQEKTIASTSRYQQKKSNLRK